MAGSNQTLQIKMFGKFSMKNGNYAFPQEKKEKQAGRTIIRVSSGEPKCGDLEKQAD